MNAALPRGLVEIFATPAPVAPGKPSPKGECKYAYRSAARLRAAELLVRMREANIVLAREGGGTDGEVDAMTSTRQLEQARRDGCLVIDSDYIRQQIEAAEDKKPVEGEPPK